MSELYLGIDGGGTRTRALLADAAGRELGMGEAGTSNPLVHGVAAAERELALAVARAFDAARLERVRAAALCMGLGGAGRAREQQELVEWAQQHLAERVSVGSDGQIVLAAGTPENWGVAVIAGTGSLAWGRNRSGETARAGGWGYLIGDEGSAFDLARGALRAATQSADGRAAPTALLDAILRFWNLDSPQDLVEYVYRAGRTHTEIAQLAPLVLEAAAKGDAAAGQLVSEAGQALAQGVGAVCRALKLGGEPIPLALTGGVLLGAGGVRVKLLDALRAAGWRYEPVNLVDQPARGAVRLAHELTQLPS